LVLQLQQKFLVLYTFLGLWSALLDVNNVDSIPIKFCIKIEGVTYFLATLKVFLIQLPVLEQGPKRCWKGHGGHWGAQGFSYKCCYLVTNMHQILNTCYKPMSSKIRHNHGNINGARPYKATSWAG